MGILSLRGNEMTVAISYFVEDLMRFLDCARNDGGRDGVLVGLLRCGGALPNKKTNGGLLFDTLKNNNWMQRHVAPRRWRLTCE